MALGKPADVLELRVSGMILNGCKNETLPDPRNRQRKRESNQNTQMSGRYENVNKIVYNIHVLATSSISIKFGKLKQYCFIHHYFNTVVTMW